MKITHCISSIDQDTGGPARSVTHLVEELVKTVSVSGVAILTLKSENPLLRESPSIAINLGFYESGLLGYSAGLQTALNEIATELFHGHGIWQPTVHQMAAVARKRHIPYVISIRGMLEPWSMQQSSLKKKLALFLFQDKDLQHAACLHATALMEVEAIRKAGYKNPVANIPNGINLEEFPQKDYNSGMDGKRKILFLSRIHHKKGLELLIAAWNTIDAGLRENWIIEIAGNGEEGYITQLNGMIRDLGLDEQISIIGSRFGEDKLKTYQGAEFFVLPTYSENFGIVIAEALSCGIPVVTTQGTPWEEIEKYNAGKWIAIGEEPLRAALIEMLKMSREEITVMGRNGRRLIEQNYSIVSVAQKMAEVYLWLLGKQKKPDFVYTS